MFKAVRPNFFVIRNRLINHNLPSVYQAEEQWKEETYILQISGLLTDRRGTE